MPLVVTPLVVVPLMVKPSIVGDGEMEPISSGFVQSKISDTLGLERMVFLAAREAKKIRYQQSR